jgi:hypothetical protein
VKVFVNNLTLADGAAYLPLTYTFNVSIEQKAGGVGASDQSPDRPPRSAFPNLLTVPQDIPRFTVINNGVDDADGYIFVSPFYWLKSTIGSYLLILDTQGDLVYYKSISDALNGYDFKKQPNGQLTYYDQKNALYHVLDASYQEVDQYRVGNGYTTDLHDLQLLPNGNALLMAYDAQAIDMSRFVQGGKPDAFVTGLILQELDPSKNVIFEWRSWDHIALADTQSDLTLKTIDTVHGNSIAVANDGNLLLSNRNTSEITKIDRQTGAVIWRMGGRGNMFRFTNDQPFAYQHDLRQLPNGNLTLFDNQGTEQNPATSRGVEYQVDEVQKTVTKVWEYIPDPAIFGTFMGNLQTLPGGSRLLDWGAPSTVPPYRFINITEVDAQNNVLFQLSFDQPYVSYRAFRFPWEGSPVNDPALAFKKDGGDLLLGYSWNGATQVASWRVFAGSDAAALTPLEERPRTGFETQSRLSSPPAQQCYYQVAALDQSGKELARSAVVSTDQAACPARP